MAESNDPKGVWTLSGLNASQVLQRVVSTFARDQKRRLDQQDDSREGGAGQTDEASSPMYSKEEVARKDKERESRLRKLKGLFNIKRRSTKSQSKAAAA